MTIAFQTTAAVRSASQQQLAGRALCRVDKKAKSVVSAAPTRVAPIMRTYDVEIDLDGTTHNIPIDEDQTFLEGIESVGLEVLHSCRAGVCVTCAAKLISGEIDSGFAAITDELKDDGYVLTCSAFPRSDGIKLEMNQFDAAYKRQYGQYELDS